MHANSLVKLSAAFIFFCTGSMAVHAQTVEELVHKGLQHDSAGRFYQAIYAFTEAIEKSPSNAVIYYNRGNSYMHTRQYGLALVDFNKSISLDTSNAPVYFNRHLANRYTSNFQFALSDINEYVSREPMDADARDARADLAMEMKEYGTAVQDVKFLIARYPLDRSYKVRLVDVYMASKDFQPAIDLLDTMLAADPEESTFYLTRAYITYYQGKYEASLTDLSLYSLKVSGNPEALKLKADNYFYLNRFDDAASIYIDLLSKDSANPNLLADYGHCLLQQKQYAKADEVLTKAIRGKGDNPAYAYLGRGLARFNLHRENEACLDWHSSYMLGEKRAKIYLDNNCKAQDLPPLKR